MVDGRARKRSQFSPTRPISTSNGSRSSPIFSDKVLLPILGDQYGRVLERGELQVHFEAGAFYLRYYDHEFPIAPGTYRHILEIALEKLAPFKNEDFYAEFQSIITALEYLPRRTETDPNASPNARARRRSSNAGSSGAARKRRKCRPRSSRRSRKSTARPASQKFRRARSLLNDQSYRLAFWRVAAEEINYRRFFDVNDLAAIRMELPEVFDATHRCCSS